MFGVDNPPSLWTHPSGRPCLASDRYFNFLDYMLVIFSWMLSHWYIRVDQLDSQCPKPGGFLNASLRTVRRPRTSNTAEISPRMCLDCRSHRPFWDTAPSTILGSWCVFPSCLAVFKHKRELGKSIEMPQGTAVIAIIPKKSPRVSFNGPTECLCIPGKPWEDRRALILISWDLLVWWKRSKPRDSRGVENGRGRKTTWAQWGTLIFNINMCQCFASCLFMFPIISHETNAILVGPILRHSHTFWSVCFDSAFSRSSWIFAARWERRAWPRMITGAAQPMAREAGNPWIAWRPMGHLSRQLATDSHWRSLAVKCCSMFAPGVSEARLVELQFFFKFPSIDVLEIGWNLCVYAPGFALKLDCFPMKFCINHSFWYPLVIMEDYYFKRQINHT